MLKLHVQGELLKGFQTRGLALKMDFMALRYEVLEIANFQYLGTCTRFLVGYQGSAYRAILLNFQEKN